jgi:hypothetical protein
MGEEHAGPGVERQMQLAPALAASRPHPATTASSIQSVIAPRAISARSYSRQFVTR